MNWTPEKIGSQAGKTFLITGANTGLGYETALELAKKSARVVMAGRNQQKLNEAATRISALVPAADLLTEVIDLNSVSAIKTFAEQFIQSGQSLDVLINNAGIMFPPPSLSADGFEAQFGVNFIGHYALTALLFPLLKRSPHGRIVTLSSMAHRNGKIDFDNLRLEKPFDKFREYGQSKVADLIFAFELQRRIDAHGLSVISTACHPGVSKTELLRTDAPEMIETVAYMNANQGAFPTLYSATDDVGKFAYTGPDGEGEVNGYPGPAFVAPYARQETVGSQLWEYAEQATAISFAWRAGP